MTPLIRDPRRAEQRPARHTPILLAVCAGLTAITAAMYAAGHGSIADPLLVACWVMWSVWGLRRWGR